MAIADPDHKPSACINVSIGRGLGQDRFGLTQAEYAGRAGFVMLDPNDDDRMPSPASLDSRAADIVCIACPRRALA